MARCLLSVLPAPRPFRNNYIRANKIVLATGALSLSLIYWYIGSPSSDHVRAFGT
jgi:hypothetical protein